MGYCIDLLFRTCLARTRGRSFWLNYLMFPLTVRIASHAFKPLYRMFVPWDDTPAGYNVWRGAVPRRKESGRLYEKPLLDHR